MEAPASTLTLSVATALERYVPWPETPNSLPALTYSTPVEADEQWFEVAFQVPAALGLTGNAAAGWTDPGGHFRLEIQHSTDLVTWSMAVMVDAAGSPADIGGGLLEYRLRSPQPIQSKVRVGQLLADVTSLSADGRHNPIILVTLAGIDQDLPNYPYQMPSDAAQLQTDLRAAGWTGATVQAAGSSDWQIAVPDVPMSEWRADNMVSWPSYFIEWGIFGEAIYSTGIGFLGTYVNTNNTVTQNPRQFCRLKYNKLKPW